MPSTICLKLKAAFLPPRVQNCKQQKPTLANSSRRQIHWEDIRWLTGSTGKPEDQAWKMGRNPGSLRHREHGQVHSIGGVCWGRCPGADFPRIQSTLAFSVSATFQCGPWRLDFCIIPPRFKDLGWGFQLVWVMCWVPAAQDASWFPSASHKRKGIWHRPTRKWQLTTIPLLTSFPYVPFCI